MVKKGARPKAKAGKKTTTKKKPVAAAAAQTTPGGSDSQKSNDVEKKTTFPLFDLPPELWIRIVKLATGDPHDHWVYVFDDGKYDSMQKDLSQPAITRTCKAIRKETLHHFYSTSIFTIHDLGCDMKWLYSWVNSIGQLNRETLFYINVFTEFINGGPGFDTIPTIIQHAGDGIPPSILGYQEFWEEDHAGAWDLADGELMEKRVYQLDIRTMKIVDSVKAGPG